MSTTRVRYGLFASLFALVGCGVAGEAAPVDHEDRAAHAHHASDATMEVGPLSDYSVYHLESEWWNQRGEVQRLEALSGRVQVVSMVYTHCSYTCPRILMDMKRVQDAIDDPEALGFVLVSIDPERDTPDRLGHFAEATRLDPRQWTLLSGSDGDILELATLLGIKYRRDGEKDFSHSNTMLVLDPMGEIVYRQVGLGEDLAPMLAAIRRVLPAPGTPSA